MLLYGYIINNIFMCDINLKYQLFIRHRTYFLLRLFMYKISKEIYFYRVVEKLFLISKNGGISRAG
ncbi:conserved hypothetical protein [Staphylococcus aureus]|uniref:Uncharacterized protein n=1 Tax=Staphylococcus aureus TaxID=1280 RepID=A0A0U1MGK5_STAAU|nr:conserved hypothetical protein [Staphylococcus aureus]